MVHETDAAMSYVSPVVIQRVLAVADKYAEREKTRLNKLGKLYAKKKSRKP